MGRSSIGLQERIAERPVTDARPGENGSGAVLALVDPVVGRLAVLRRHPSGRHGAATLADLEELLGGVGHVLLPLGETTGSFCPAKEDIARFITPVNGRPLSEVERLYASA